MSFEDVEGVENKVTGSREWRLTIRALGGGGVKGSAGMAQVPAQRELERQNFPFGEERGYSPCLHICEGTDVTKTH